MKQSVKGFSCAVAAVLIAVVMAASCVTKPFTPSTRFAIDNSRSKAYELDPMSFTVISIAERQRHFDPEQQPDVSSRLMELDAQVLICQGSKAFLQELKEDLPLNMAVIEDDVLIATPFHILQRSGRGVLIQLTREQNLVAAVSELPEELIKDGNDLPAILQLPVDTGPPKDSEMLDLQPQVENESLQYALYGRGLLPLDYTLPEISLDGFTITGAKAALPEE
ncbi:MAG: hypothetical protein ACQEQU_00180 [Spirochaetota bacterium]